MGKFSLISKLQSSRYVATDGPETFKIKRHELSRQAQLGAIPALSLVTQESEQDAAIGEFHEQLRLRCEDILGEFKQRQTLLADVEDAFGAMNIVSRQLEQTIKKLGETEAQKTRLLDLEQRLRDKLIDVERDKEQLSRRCTKLDVSFKKMTVENKTQKELLDRFQKQIGQYTEKFDVLAADHAKLREKFGFSLFEVKVLKARLESQSVQLEMAECEREKLIERSVVEREEAREQAKRGAALERMLINLKTSNADVMQAEIQARANFVTLEVKREKLAAENKDLRASVAENEALTMTNKVAYESRIESQSNRLLLFEQLLHQARDALLEEVNHKKEFIELKKQLEDAYQDLRKVKNENMFNINARAEFEPHNVEFTKKIRHLQADLTEQDILVQKAVAAVEIANSKLSSTKEASRLDKRALIDQVKILKDDLVKSESGLSVAEGALEVARKDRLQLQKTIMRLTQDEDKPSLTKPVYIAEAGPKHAIN